MEILQINESFELIVLHNSCPDLYTYHPSCLFTDLKQHRWFCPRNEVFHLMSKGVTMVKDPIIEGTR